MRNAHIWRELSIFNIFSIVKILLVSILSNNVGAILSINVVFQSFRAVILFMFCIYQCFEMLMLKNDHFKTFLTKKMYITKLL